MSRNSLLVELNVVGMHTYKNVVTLQRFTHTAQVQLFSSVPLDIIREVFETEHLRYIRERHVSLGRFLISASKLYMFVLYCNLVRIFYIQIVLGRDWCRRNYRSRSSTGASWGYRGKFAGACKTEGVGSFPPGHGTCS